MQPSQARPKYVLDMQLDYSAKSATVNETITYPNWTGETLNNLVLAVEPNLWSGGFTLKSISIDNQPVTSYTIENMNQKLEVQLPQSLAPSGTVIINITYGLLLPQMQAYINASNDVRPQIYGYSDKQVNFIDWYPFVVPYIPGQGWILHNPWYYGEHLVYDLADFDVKITFTDGTNPLVASSGEEIGTPPPRQATGDPPGTVVPPTSVGIVTRHFVL